MHYVFMPYTLMGTFKTDSLTTFVMTIQYKPFIGQPVIALNLIRGRCVIGRFSANSCC